MHYSWYNHGAFLFFRQVFALACLFFFAFFGSFFALSRLRFKGDIVCEEEQ